MEDERILEILWPEGSTIFSYLLSYLTRLYHLLEEERCACPGVSK